MNIFLKWFLKRKPLFNYQYIHSLIFSKAHIRYLLQPPYPCTEKYAFGGTPHPPPIAYVLYVWPPSRLFTRVKYTENLKPQLYKVNKVVWFSFELQVFDIENVAIYSLLIERNFHIWRISSSPQTDQFGVYSIRKTL